MAVEPAHIKRLKGVMYVMRSFIEQNDDGSGLGRMAFIMTTITDELAEELVDYDEMRIRAFMFQIGEVISWIGHGDNDRLPDIVREFAEGIQPSGSKSDEASRASKRSKDIPPAVAQSGMVDERATDESVASTR